MIQLVEHTAETGELSWIAGHKFAAQLTPQILMLDPKHGNNIPDFFDSSVPMMSNRLIAFLRNLGVDNIDTYPVVLHNIVSGENVPGYSAVNVIQSIADALKTEPWSGILLQPTVDYEGA
jgi:hypothetical protein